MSACCTLTLALTFYACQKKNQSATCSTCHPLADSMMVVSARHEASEVGLQIMLDGGNAFDAAIAVHFALAVVYPQAGNIGGGGFMIAHTQYDENICLDFRETAPLAAYEKMYLHPDGTVQQRASLLGGLACGVPGSVHGMFELHRKYGSKSWYELLQPAIHWAENGFVLTSLDVEEINAVRHELDSINGMNVFTSRRWKEGDTLRQPDLARTLILIAHNPSCFYKGAIADTLIAAVNNSGGILQKDDLLAYRSVWRKPIEISFLNYRIITMPPPGSGGLALAQILSWLEMTHVQNYKHHSASYIQLIAELEKRAYADRSMFLGDPDFIQIPLSELLSKEYLSNRLEMFPVHQVTPSTSILPGEISFHEHEQTTHFSIVDAFGNAVSLTTTINSAYGSRLIVNGAGFIMNNEMDDFSVKPGEKNQFGLLGGKANRIQANKRMLSSMTPVVVLKDNNPVMVIGSPGGATIITTVLQNLLNVLVFNMGMQESVNQPRFHHQWMPDVLFLEPAWEEWAVLVDSLRRMGYTIQFRSPIGRVSAIVKTPGGKWEGGADTRGDNVACGR